MLQWKPDVGIAELIALLGLIAVLASILFAVRQLQQNGQELQLNNTVARAQFLLDVTQGYFGDEKLVEFFYRLDYATGPSAFVFDPETFPGSKEELHLDKLLYTYDLIGQLVQLDMLTFEEVRLFAFQASRVLRNKEVQKYLAWLEIEYRKYGDASISLKPHEDALWLVEALLGIDINYRRYKRLYAPQKRKTEAQVEAEDEAQAEPQAEPQDEAQDDLGASRTQA